jgi:hypothetical protein
MFSTGPWSDAACHNGRLGRFWQGVDDMVRRYKEIVDMIDRIIGLKSS